MKRTKYASDISREKFAEIEQLLRSVRRSTKPTTVDLYEVFCAVLYLLRTGCQWRFLPREFPKWQSVYAYWSKWSEPDRYGVSVLEWALKKSGWRGPREIGAQRLQRALDRRRAEREKHRHGQPERLCAGKKVSGIKRHIAVDTQGLPHAIAVTTAEVTDRKGALQALERCRPGLGQVQSLLCDSGYTGEPFAEGVREILGKPVTVQIARRSELHTFKVMPKRWIVERSFAWLPQSVQDGLQRISLRLQIGHYRDYALPEPDFSSARAHPTINSALSDKIRHGKVHPRPGIEKISGQTVYFADNATTQYDVLIAATGYKISFPSFDRDFLDWEEVAHIPLFLRIFHPDHPSLFFVGLIQPQGCIWPLAEIQARLIGQLLTNKIQLTLNWRKLALSEGRNWAQQFIARPRHSIEVHYYPYLKQLQRMIQGQIK